jgi:hypothetical protein
MKKEGIRKEKRHTRFLRHSLESELIRHRIKLHFYPNDNAASMTRKGCGATIWKTPLSVACQYCTHHTFFLSLPHSRRVSLPYQTLLGEEQAVTFFSSCFAFIYCFRCRYYFR